MASSTALASVRVERNSFFLRGERVTLDAHLAPLYGVTTRALVQAVKRNPSRFPVDFMFTDLARKLATLEKKYDAQFRVVFDALREMMAPPAKSRRAIGFRR